MTHKSLKLEKNWKTNCADEFKEGEDMTFCSNMVIFSQDYKPLSTVISFKICWNHNPLQYSNK